MQGACSVFFIGHFVEEDNRFSVLVQAVEQGAPGLGDKGFSIYPIEDSLRRKSQGGDSLRGGEQAFDAFVPFPAEAFRAVFAHNSLPVLG